MQQTSNSSSSRPALAKEKLRKQARNSPLRDRRSGAEASKKASEQAKRLLGFLLSGWIVCLYLFVYICLFIFYLFHSSRPQHEQTQAYLKWRKNWYAVLCLGDYTAALALHLLHLLHYIAIESARIHCVAERGVWWSLLEHPSLAGTHRRVGGR